MAKILVFNIPAYGHVNATLAVVHELITRGHEVLYYCGEEMRTVIDKTGATFKPYPESQMHSREIAQRAYNLADVSLLLLDVSHTLIPFALGEIGTEKPDLVMYDSVNIWARVACDLTQTPSVTTFSAAVMEGVSGLFDMRMKLYLMATALPKIPRLLYLRSKLVRTYGAEVLGFPLFPSKGQLNLVFSSREFQMETDFVDDSFRFVGASIHPELREEAPIDLTGIHQPLIYVSLGTVNNQNLSFYRAVMDVLRDFPAQIILSIGKQMSIDDLQPVPDNFHVMSSVPQLQVLERADAFVTHGGMNSVQESLYYGVPMVVVPQQLEQAFNGKRVQEIGAGRVVGVHPPFGKVDADDLSNAVRYILNDERYKTCAMEQRGYLHQSGGYARAVDEIEAFMRNF